MRWATIFAGIAIAMASLMPASASLGAGLPRAKLALVPLPKAALGPLSANLSLAPDSGTVTNVDAADTTNGPATAKMFAELGRLRGYSLDYGNPFVGGSGVREVQTTVEMYRDAASAARGLEFWRKDESGLAGLGGHGVTMSNTPVSVPAAGEEHFAYRGRIGITGSSPIYGVDEYFRRGVFVVEVSVTTGSATAAMQAAPALTRKAEARLGLVLAGKLTGPPVRLPGPTKAGPPPQGPDLSTLVLKPADLGHATVAHQGYRVDKNLHPVSEFAVTMTPGGNFASLNDDVMLLHNPVEARYTMAVMNAALSRPETFSDPSIRHVDVRHVSVAGGDEAYGAIVTMKVKNGKSIVEALVLVRRGALLAFVTAATGMRILPSAVTDLAALTATRLG